jgi:hypothetical protein
MSRLGRAQPIHALYGIPPGYGGGTSGGGGSSGASVSVITPITGIVFSTTATTPSFNPPAGVLIAACFNELGSTAPTVSNNGTALTWTLINSQVGSSGGIWLYHAPLTAARTGMTVTMTTGSTTEPMIGVLCVTGALASGYIGGKVNALTTTASFTTTGFTTQGSNSLGIIAAIESAGGSQVPSSSDTTNEVTSSALIGWKTLGATGSSATFNMAYTGGTGTQESAYCAVEILSALVPAVPLLATPLVPRLRAFNY